MKVASVVHFAAPYRNAGSETVLHLMLRALVEAGHEVTCWVTDIPRIPDEQEYEGVRLIRARNVAVAIRAAQRYRPDVVVTHHQNSVACLRYLQEISGIPVVYLSHNDHSGNRYPLNHKPALVVHNSEWVQDALARYYSGPSLVIHPPLDRSRHEVPDAPPPFHREAITLINSNADKGAHIVHALAARNPDLTFLTVKGGHGVQVVPPRDVRNVKMVDHSPDLRGTWARTKILLMPSIYESYGLVGLEAGISGIPTIASPTPGLKESQGAAGVFVQDRDNLEQWDHELMMLLLDPTHYEERSVAAKKNAEEKISETAENLARFVKEVESL